MTPSPVFRTTSHLTFFRSFLESPYALYIRSTHPGCP